MGTRDRIVVEGMRLFGARGYDATSVAQIERAAGLSAGSGGLYKHFPSKRSVLEAGVRERIAASDDLTSLLGAVAGAGSTRERLRAIATAGLARLRGEEDLSRVLVRDLRQFPDLLDEFRTAELGRLHGALTALLTQEGAADAASVAGILIDALSHYWLMSDIYGGTHPLALDEDRYLDALADLAARACDEGRSA
jgi:AcrR family transcriptional regulator